MKLTPKGKARALKLFTDLKKVLDINKEDHHYKPKESYYELILYVGFTSQQERDHIFKLIEEANKVK